MKVISKQNTFPTLAYFILVLMVIITACSKEEGEEEKPPINAQLLLSPENIMLNDDETKSLFLSVQPAASFTWNMAAKPDWIEVNVASGTINNEVQEIVLTPNPIGLSTGKHTGAIEIISNGAGKATSSITLCVEGRPSLQFTPGELRFLADENAQVFSLSNVGTGFLDWQWESIPTWIKVDVLSGMLDEGTSVDIIVSVDRSMLPIGNINDVMVLTTNAEDGNRIEIMVEVVNPPKAELSVSNVPVVYGFFDESQSFYLRNDGNTPVAWNVELADNSFITFDPSQGSLNGGDSVLITMIVDRSSLNSQTYSLDLMINNDIGGPVIVPIEVNHYEEEKLSIAGQVIDAEYDRVNDQLIVVTESPNEIVRIDIENEVSQSLPLNLSPTCVSVGLDGKEAVVGHNGRFSYVNLTDMTLTKIYPITTEAFDIVLAPNGWVYVFPLRDQWINIHCIQLSDGVETLNSGNLIREQTVAKLHPSGEYIYGANNGLSPSDFEKYDIRNGVAEYLYDSPYHGEYDFAGDIWISEDGQRLFAKSRNVFNASTDFSGDMTYNGSLEGEGNLLAMDVSAAAQKVFAILGTGDPWENIPGHKVSVYDGEFLGFEKEIDLPGFLIADGNGGGTFYRPEGHYGFFNSEGSKFYAIVKAESGSAVENSWAIATISVE